MKDIGLLKIIKSVYRYNKLTYDKKQKLQKERLSILVKYAKGKSPYFEKLYSNIGDDFNLKELPLTNKVKMMENFDQWITDRSINLYEINKFTNNLDNIGRKFKGKYLVFTTSGSTGNPSVVLYDKTARNVMSAVSLFRSYARKEDLKEFIKRGGKSAGVYATGGFYLGNSTIRNKLLVMPWKKKQLMVTSVLNPLQQIVKELNKFQPAMLGGYPTALELLMEEQKRGSLKISPIIIMTGGEYLSDTLRMDLADTFKCYVQTGYSCTEGGMLACECKEKHFHINEDWIIIEAVDKDNNPVPEGTVSDKILLTNLANFTQPIIRFEITDRVILHKEQCSCGNTSPWLEVEGRTDEILEFLGNSEESVKIAPLAFYALLKEVHEIKRFQLIQHQGNELELRIVCDERLDKVEVFKKAKDELGRFMSDNRVENIRVTLSDEIPQVHSKSGKFKHIYKL
jgi:phenylacetate-coenzyme A ligase PaaK-like adenylate-forming protein